MASFYDELSQKDRDTLDTYMYLAQALGVSLQWWIPQSVWADVAANRCLPPLYNLKRQDSIARKLLQYRGRLPGNDGAYATPDNRPATTLFGRGSIDDLIRWRVCCFLWTACKGVAARLASSIRDQKQDDIQVVEVSGDAAVKVNPRGYRGYNLKLRLDVSRHPAAQKAGIRDFFAEVQVTSVNAAAWGELDHMLVYKNDAAIRHHIEKVTQQQAIGSHPDPARQPTALEILSELFSSISGSYEDLDERIIESGSKAGALIGGEWWQGISQ